MIISIIKKLAKKPVLPNPLGRWTIESCNKKTDSKIDLSNEDHCGPCGQYLLSKNDMNKPAEISTRSSSVNKTVLKFAKKTKFDI
jgi:hypothetical protein